MTMNNKALLFCFCVFAFVFCRAQDDWKLKTDKDGIRTYLRKAEDSKINAIKVEADFTASLSRFASVIADVASYDDWVFNSSSTRLLKQVSPSELYYYSEIKFPWPATNRDFVSHITIHQDPQTKTVRINATNVAGWEPVKKNIVRINNSVGKWTIRPAGKEKLNVVYELQADPGGGLPAWLINSFSSTGMVETFKNLRGLLNRKTPAANTLSFIAN